MLSTDTARFFSCCFLISNIFNVVFCLEFKWSEVYNSPSNQIPNLASIHNLANSNVSNDGLHSIVNQNSSVGIGQKNGTQLPVFETMVDGNATWNGTKYVNSSDDIFDLPVKPFTKEEKVEGFLLVGHVFKELFNAHLVSQCSFECLRAPQCLSYSFNQRNHSCLLNAAVDDGRNNSMVAHKDFTYYTRKAYDISEVRHYIFSIQLIRNFPRYRRFQNRGLKNGAKHFTGAGGVNFKVES